MWRIDRRRFLAGLGASAAWPVLAQPRSALASDVDVVIIGAGAAGLAAARKLAAAGRSIAIIEAMERVGGRAVTDTALFGRPVDLGAHWLHDAGNNPMPALARAAGLSLETPPDEPRLDIAGRAASDAELDAFEAAFVAMDEAIASAGEAGRDVAASSVAPDVGEWQSTIEFLIGPYDAGVDLDRLSTLDYIAGGEGGDLFCREGYGTLVAGLAAGLPIRLSTMVERIDWSGQGVRVGTSAGTIRARLVIVTASTNALLSGRMSFDPVLPAPTIAALEALPLSTYNHIVLEIPGDPLSLGANAQIAFKLDGPDGTGVLANVGGGPLWLADVGGGFGRELEEESNEVAIDWAKDFLAQRYGADFRKAIERAHVTHWGDEPTVLGAYSAAQPGKARERARLREIIGDRIILAGEATSLEAFATVHGAFAEGERAALEAMRLLG